MDHFEPDLCAVGRTGILACSLETGIFVLQTRQRPTRLIVWPGGARILESSRLYLSSEAVLTFTSEL